MKTKIEITIDGNKVVIEEANAERVSYELKTDPQNSIGIAYEIAEHLRDYLEGLG
jgi:hypothetical protein